MSPSKSLRFLRKLLGPNGETKPKSSSARGVRNLHLGIDFGTSQSKLILKDYGAVDAERSIVVRPSKKEGGNGDFRVPSTISLNGETLRFGFDAEKISGKRAVRLFRSIKMRAADLTFYGERADLPAGLTAVDLATLLVAYLVQRGVAAAERYTKQYRQSARLALTMGVPMSQLDNPQLQQVFLEIALQAFKIQSAASDLADGISVGQARSTLDEVRKDVGSKSASSPRDWVRSEAEAGLLWAFQSPEIAGGVYSCVDVGAGTTSATWFKIVDERRNKILSKERMAFFGAACNPPGCDAIDEVLAAALQRSDAADARGRENQLIPKLSSPQRQRLVGVLDEIADVFGEASTRAFEKHKRMSAWTHEGQLFLMGGGTKIQVVRDVLVRRKQDWLKTEPVANVGVPTDMVEESGEPFSDDASFLLVAYGLAHRLGDVPDIFPPSQIPPIPTAMPQRPRISHEDIYSD